MASRILLIEDDESIGAGLAEALAARGHAVDWQCSGGDGLAAFGDDSHEVVLLDLGLPDLDGVEVCRRLRATDAHLAIVILSARGDEADIVVGLQAGADDYVSKPFGLDELLARIAAQERRRLAREARRGEGALTSGALRLDEAARWVGLDDVELQLTAKEFDLLALLLREQGRAVSREQILDTVWDTHWQGSTKTLDMHILTLRRKLAEAAGPAEAPPRITTLRGVGYRLEAE